MHKKILLCLLISSIGSLGAAAGSAIHQYDIAPGVGGALRRTLCAPSHLTLDDNFLNVPNQGLYAFLDPEVSFDMSRVDKAFAALKKTRAADADVYAIFSSIMQKVDEGLIFMVSDDRAIIFSKGSAQKATLILQGEDEFVPVLPGDRAELVTTSWMYNSLHRGLVLSRGCPSQPQDIAKAVHAALKRPDVTPVHVAAAVLALEPHHDAVVVYLDAAALGSSVVSDGDRPNPLVRTMPDRRSAKTKKCILQ